MKRKKTKRGFIPIKILVVAFIVIVIVFTVSLSVFVYKTYKQGTSRAKINKTLKSDKQGTVNIIINRRFVFRGTTHVNVPSSATNITPFGDTVNANLFSVKVTKVERFSKLSGIIAAKGMQLVRISLYIKNNDNQSDFISDSDFYYQTQKGQRIDDVTNYANLSAANTNDELARSLNPQQVDTSDHLVFQVPIGDKGTLVWFANTTEINNDANIPLPSSLPIYKFAIFAL